MQVDIEEMGMDKGLAMMQWDASHIRTGFDASTKELNNTKKRAPSYTQSGASYLDYMHREWALHRSWPTG